MSHRYAMKDLQREAAAVVKGHGTYCGHAIEINDTDRVVLVVYYVPKDAKKERDTFHGWPSLKHEGRYETTVAI